MIRYRRIDTPIGELVLSGDDALGGVWFVPHRDSSAIQRSWSEDPGAFPEAEAQPLEYLEGDRRSFDLRLRPAGTDFQQRVWRALTEIPYGATRTYADLATALDSSPRAVGHANARNPLSIIVPCHRVVGATGLTGYAGGVDRKRQLLELESAVAGNEGSSSLRP